MLLRSSLALGLLLMMLATGVAFATPVPILRLETAGDDAVRPFDDGEGLVYSYRQSIYLVPVYEEFVRVNDHIELLRVRSSDIRSVEYFRWDGVIARDAEGLWTEVAPRNAHRELVIRVVRDAEQRVATARWSVDLATAFGEGVVTVRVEQRPRLVTLLQGAG
jgi:hypothetical protein